MSITSWLLLSSALAVSPVPVAEITATIRRVQRMGDIIDGRSKEAEKLVITMYGRC